VEREILFTGIGGQGVQLAANVLAHAALEEGHDVQVFGSYGGMMRGGNTDAVLVVADAPIQSPPTVDAAWAAVLMHPDYAAPTLARLRSDGVALRNAPLWDGPLTDVGGAVIDVAASDLAVGVGHVMAASIVMLGALAALTHLVALDALSAGVRACIPPYRAQHIDLNERALAVGASAVVPVAAFDAWAPAGAGVLR
jgi:Pyruvate/2-oxoacid:ferredoxin oxidoreductase gamma subunit